MNTAVVVASSVLVLILICALTREVRLRRALQRLVARLLSYWRSQHEDEISSLQRGDDRDIDRDDRLRRPGDG